MDILSLTSIKPVGAEILGRPVGSTGTVPAPQTSGVDPTDKAPPGSNATGAAPQKEAPRTGQTAPENLLDLLKGLIGETEAGGLSLSLGDQKVNASLKEVGLPPRPEDLLRALSAMGIHVPQALVALEQAQGSPASWAQAIQQAANIPQPVKDVLIGLLRQSMAKPLPASQLIDLGRPVPATPIPVPHSGPSAYAPVDATPRPASAPLPMPALIQTVAGFDSNLVPVASSGQAFDTETVEALNLTGIYAESTPYPTAPPVPSSVTGDGPISHIDHPVPVAGPVTVLDFVASEVPVATSSSTIREQFGLLPGVQDLSAIKASSLGRPVPTADGITDKIVPAAGPAPHAVPNGAPVATSGVGRNVAPVPRETGPVAASTAVAPKPHAVPSGVRASVGGQPVPTASTGILEWPVEGSQIAEIDKAAVADLKAPVAGTDDDSVVGQSDTSVSVLGRPVQVTIPKATDAGNPLPAAIVKTVSEQIADRIETMVLGKKGGKVTVHLTPNDLGTITLSVRSFGTRIDTSIRASNDDVRAALQNHRLDLVQTVESRGLSLNSFHIGQEANGGDRHQAHQSLQAEADRNAHIRQATGQPAASVLDQPQPGWSSSRGVDYLV